MHSSFLLTPGGGNGPADCKGHPGRKPKKKLLSNLRLRTKRERGKSHTSVVPYKCAHAEKSRIELVVTKKAAKETEKGEKAI